MVNTTRKSIGIISDTHGVVRPQAIEALEGVEMILRATLEASKYSTP
jgi:hypothetical protein